MLDEGIELVAHAISRPSREVNAGSSFQADTLAPQQYQQTMRRKPCREPEQELMLAVLKEAIYCIQSICFGARQSENAPVSRSQKLDHGRG